MERNTGLIELRFPAGVYFAVRNQLKANGWTWDAERGAWIHERTVDASRFAFKMLELNRELGRRFSRG